MAIKKTYVTFENGHMKLDVKGWLATPEGREQVKQVCASAPVTTQPAPVDVRLRELAEKYSTRAKNWRSQRSEYAAGNAKQAEDIEDDLRALLSAKPSADAGVDRTTGVKP